MKRLILLLFACLISGCATISGKTQYPVAITSTPSDAKFVITNQDGTVVHQGETPATVTLKSSAGYFDGEKYHVRFTKDGFEEAGSDIDSDMSEYYSMNAVFGGLIGFLIVDPLSGAMWKLPESTSAALVKKSAE